MALKVITPSFNTGTDPVGTDDYRSGMVAARDSLGNVVLAGTESAAGTDGPKNKAIGLFGEDRITTTLQQTSQVLEEVTVTSGVAVALSHNGVVPDSQRVIIKSSGALQTEGVNYSFDDANGTITSINIASGTVVQVTFTFKLNDQVEKDFRGVNFKGSTDDTAGSKKATVWKGFGEFQTDQFVTNQAYAIAQTLRFTHSSHAMGAGLLTNEAGGSTVVAIAVARVNKVPTAADPFLGAEWIGGAADDIP